MKTTLTHIGRHTVAIGKVGDPRARDGYQRAVTSDGTGIIVRRLTYRGFGVAVASWPRAGW